MYDFYYHIKFRMTLDKFDIMIFLSLEDLFTPVFIRLCDKSILEDKAQFLMVYQEFEEYLDKKHIVINEDDLRLFYQTLISFDVELPNVVEVMLNRYDEGLDEYAYILTPKDIVFLKYADGKAIDDKRFKTWDEDNHLNTYLLREEMLDNKLLTTDDYSYNLMKAKREHLLEVVKMNGLDIHGDNNDLIERIKTELTEEDIKKHFTGSHLTLTKKGKKIIDQNRKLIDFSHSFFHYVNKLPLEEFHLLSIKKIDYDFNGIGRLLMVNTTNEIEFFDWKTLKHELKEEDPEIVKSLEEVKSMEENELHDFIKKISVSYDEDNNETEPEEIIEIEKQEVEEEDTLKKETTVDEEIDNLDDTEDIDFTDIYVEDDHINKEKLEAYRTKREMYENNRKKNQPIEIDYSDGYDEKKDHPILKVLLYISIINMALIGLLYLNDQFSIIKLPFSLKDIYDSLIDTFKMYNRKVLDFIDYVKDYKS